MNQGVGTSLSRALGTLQASRVVDYRSNSPRIKGSSQLLCCRYLNELRSLYPECLMASMAILPESQALLLAKPQDDCKAEYAPHSGDTD